MENWQLALLTAALALVGAVFSMAIKSPKKFIVLANAAMPVLAHLASASAGFMLASLLAGKFWGMYSFVALFALEGLRRAAGSVAEHLIRADLEEERDKRSEPRDEEPDA